jgi:IS1 family transposase
MGKITFSGGSASTAVSAFPSSNRSRLTVTLDSPRKQSAASFIALSKGTACAEQPGFATLKSGLCLAFWNWPEKPCERLFTERVRGVRVHDLELDEVWTYVKKHQKQIRPGESAQYMGDAYTFIGLERTSKLVVAWHLGKRDRINTEDFISKIRWATAPGRFDVSTDGFQPYETAIDAGLYDRANHAAVVKMFSTTTQVVPESYRPARFVSVGKDAVSGNPDLDRAGTSHVERKNATLRTWCKRLCRLTLCYSKKWENLKAALALHFAHYNFCRIHGSLRITPAMAAGIADHVWEIGELIHG